ncbi:hypothetical protein BH11PSE4_BH11PSE4_33260 [soil metagenome]
MVDSSARLKLVIARLEDSRAILIEAGERETAQLVAMALLQLRMRMHHIGDAELKALCDAIEADPKTDSDHSKASGDRSS